MDDDTAVLAFPEPCLPGDRQIPQSHPRARRHPRWRDLVNGGLTIPFCETRFPAVTASITAARHWLRDCVDGFGGPLRRHRMIQTAELLVSELITNAIRHGSGPPLIQLTWNERWLHTAVSDSSDRRPHKRATANTEPGGFGIQLLDRLARRWGVTPGHPGTTVWAELSLDC
jgi:anti-sigma regulatory factor (Ser/Thr protein kinase)